MGFFRFRRSVKLFPGVRWNFGKKSTSLSIGPRGAHYTVGTSGSRTTIGIPGTGLSYTETSGHAPAPEGGTSGCMGCLGQIIVLLLVLGGISMCVNSGKETPTNKKSTTKPTATPQASATPTPQPTPTPKATQVFFATVQNLLIFAVTRKTAAELITSRANAADPHFGLLAWKSNKVRKQDILVAKNYLTEDEIDTLNRLVVIFLETAELRAKGRQETRMDFWKENVDQIISSNGFPLLTHAGSISNEQMEERTGELYIKFDQDRKKREAIEADQQDEAELKTLETKLKRRKK